MSMFCYQCEQTAKGTGCEVQGVCGKSPEVAALQDLLLNQAQGISMYAHRARQLGAAVDHSIGRFIAEALFTTITNVNFDDEAIAAVIRRAADVKAQARAAYEAACQARNEPVSVLGGPAASTLPSVLQDLIAEGAAVGIMADPDLDADARGLRELLVYGLKGLAAYADHAMILGKEDDALYDFCYEALDAVANARSDERVSSSPGRTAGGSEGDANAAGDLLGLCLKCGEVNIGAMGLLNTAHIERLGAPEPTPVRIEPKAGPAILISGHDLVDLEALLQQVDGTDVNVYTHGEMLPAHGYPGLKKYANLAGNYGGAWQDQAKEFDAFPGPIVMTTNCIQRPRDSYIDRIYTLGLVGWPGVKHMGDRDFSGVIAQAQALGGFEADGADKTILVGFGHDAVLGVAETVIGAVKAGAIKHFFLIGGCDGAKSGRNYFTEMAEKVPQDCVILTLACGKYRFNKLEFGDIGGVPRLLDVGQCNDAYSAVLIAQALAGAFECGVNDLPLSFVLSWYEQKAVVILLSLLHLGIKDIRLGPSLPAFVTPNMLQILVDNFNIMPTGEAEEDLAAMLGA